MEKEDEQIQEKKAPSQRSDDARDEPPARPWARTAAVVSLVVGIIGVALAWIPVVGRLIALACGIVALLAGVVGVRATTAGAASSRHAVAIAGLTLGFVCLYETLRLTGCSVLGGAATDAVLGLAS